MHDFLDFTFWDNSVERWGKFILLVLLAYLVKKYISNILGTLLYQPFRKFSTDNEGKKFVALLGKPMELLILFITVYLAFKTLHYPSSLELGNEDLHLKSILNKLMKTIGAVAITWVLLRIIDFMSYIFHLKYSTHEKGIDEQIVPFVKDSAKVVVVIITIILGLSLIYKLNVAGIGIGGLAVALAAKESLENLLGSFTIFIDKPFHVGDMVQVGSVTGIVERVGFRSTRIRTENKTFVTVPNKQIVDSFLDNITERTHRRVEIKLQLNQNTDAAKLTNAMEEIKIALTSEALIEPEFTVLFNAINTFSFEIQVVFLVQQIDIKTFNEIKQHINFSVIKILKNNTIEFAQNDSMQKIV